MVSLEDFKLLHKWSKILEKFYEYQFWVHVKIYAEKKTIFKVLWAMTMRKL